MKGLFIVHYCVIISACFVTCEDLDDVQDKSDWVDPWDMEPGSPPAPSQLFQRMKNNNNNNNNNNNKNPGQNNNGFGHEKKSGANPDSMKNRFEKVTNCAESELKLQKCLRRLNVVEESVVIRDDGKCPEFRGTESDRESEARFFNRFLRFLMRNFELDENEERKTFRLRVDFERNMADVFKLYLSGKDNYQDVDRVLSEIFTSVVPEAEIPAEFDFPQRRPNDDYSSLVRNYLPSHEDFFWISAFALFSGFLALLWNGIPFWKFTSLVLLLSSAWHWTHLYKKKMSSKHLTLVKNSAIPPECFPETFSWTDVFMDAVFSTAKSRCKEYHDALLIDPFWEVSPTMAIAETITTFILLPLEHLGTHIGKFFAALLGQVSWISSPAILGFVFVALLLILIMTFGYKFNFPFFLGSFEPNKGNDATSLKTPAQFKALEDKVRMLQNQLTESRFQRIKVMPKNESTVKPIKLESEFDAVQSQGHHRDDDDDHEQQRAPTFLTGAPENPDEVLDLSRKPLLTCDKNKKPTMEDEAISHLKGVEDLSIQKTPKKKLVVKGSASSPWETDFEWVIENEDQGQDEEDADNGNDANDAKEKKDYLEEIKSVFHDMN